MIQPSPTLNNEIRLWSEGYRAIAGLDEVGRGAWAGPVFAAAVVLPAGVPELDSRLAGVRDSKLLSPRQRVRLVETIRSVAIAVGIGQASHEEVDRLGVVGATRRAMCLAISGLRVPPEYLLIDALQLRQVDLPQLAIIKGDMLCLSIAAASIVAKVARDELCLELDRDYPGYGFAQHKGYGTALHRQCLAELGPAPIHRRSYEPVRAVCDLWALR